MDQEYGDPRAHYPMDSKDLVWGQKSQVFNYFMNQKNRTDQLFTILDRNRYQNSNRRLGLLARTRSTNENDIMFLCPEGLQMNEYQELINKYGDHRALYPLGYQDLRREPMAVTSKKESDNVTVPVLQAMRTGGIECSYKRERDFYSHIGFSSRQEPVLFKNVETRKTSNRHQNSCPIVGVGEVGDFFLF